MQEWVWLLCLYGLSWSVLTSLHVTFLPEAPADGDTTSPVPRSSDDGPPSDLGSSTEAGHGSPLQPLSAEPPADVAQAQGEERLLYVVRYNYSAAQEGQLSIKKRENVTLIRKNEVGDWCEVVNGQGEVGWVPTSFIAQVDTSERQSWHHGNITRAEAEGMLEGTTDGSFLVRESQTKRGEYSISLRHEGNIFHYQIHKEPSTGGYYVSPNAQFQTLDKLIAHHSSSPDGLHTTLQHPLPYAR